MTEHSEQFGLKDALSKALCGRIVLPGEEELRGMFDPRGRHSKLSLSSLWEALVYHQLQGPGSGALEDHVEELFGQRLAASSLSQRRALWPKRFIDRVCELSLKPLADPQHHPGCFYRGLRLVGIDGSKFDAPNTPDHDERLSKHSNQYATRSAYSELKLSTLVEIGCRNPIAVAVAEGSAQAEYNLSVQLYQKVPPGSLLLIDKLYGRTQNLHRMLETFRDKDAHFVVPLPSRTKYEVERVLADGSAMVSLKLRKHTAPNPNKIIGKLSVRLIKAGIMRSDGKCMELTLVSDLSDEAAYPGAGLVTQYVRRWEHEVFYYELKPQMNRGDVLRAKTLETCHQDILALVLASHVLATLRIQAASESDTDPLRISFVKVKRIVEAFWTTINICHEVLHDEQVAAMVEVMNQQIAKQIKPPKRSRSCARVNHHHKSRKRSTRTGAHTTKVFTETHIHHIQA